MARKKLTQGPNAARVARRIAQVPQDTKEGNIFTAIRDIDPGEQEVRTESASTGDRQNPKREPSRGEQEPQQEHDPEAARGRKKESTGRRPAGTGVRLTELEKELIVRSCREYKNNLPSYLQSVQRELETLDGIIAKLS